MVVSGKWLIFDVLIYLYVIPNVHTLPVFGPFVPIFILIMDFKTYTLMNPYVNYFMGSKSNQTRPDCFLIPT